MEIDEHFVDNNGHPVQDGFQRAQNELLQDLHQHDEDVLVIALEEEIAAEIQPERVIEEVDNGNNEIVGNDHPDVPGGDEVVDAQTLRKREINKIQARNYRDRMKNERINASVVWHQLYYQVDNQKKQNNERESCLQFAANTVLPLFMNDNNRVMDPSEVSRRMNDYQRDKEQIILEWDNQRDNDPNVRQTGEQLDDAQAGNSMRGQRTRQRALAANPREGTVGSRKTRSKQEYELCFYKHYIEYNKFDIKKEHQLSSLLDENWNYFRSTIFGILKNSQEYLKVFAIQNDKKPEMRRLFELFGLDSGLDS